MFTIIHSTLAAMASMQPSPQLLRLHPLKRRWLFNSFFFGLFVINWQIFGSYFKRVDQIECCLCARCNWVHDDSLCTVIDFMRMKLQTTLITRTISQSSVILFRWLELEFELRSLNQHCHCYHAPCTEAMHCTGNFASRVVANCHSRHHSSQGTPCAYPESLNSQYFTLRPDLSTKILRQHNVGPVPGPLGEQNITYFYHLHIIWSKY